MARYSVKLSPVSEVKPNGTSSSVARTRTINADSFETDAYGVAFLTGSVRTAWFPNGHILEVRSMGAGDSESED